MRIGLDRTTIVFIIFLLIIGGIFGVQRFVENQPPIEITVAVDPLAEEWVSAAAAAYNETKPIINRTTPVLVSITVMDDLDVWRGNPNWNSTNHPHAWIPSSSLSLELAPPSLPFAQIQPSLARTPLVWGGYSDRVRVITQDGVRPFDWDAVQEIATAQRWDNLGEDGGNINMAINWPTSSMAGIGALLIATAENGASPTINRSQIDDAFTTWFQPIGDTVLNSQRIGGSPAEAIASRGMSVADYALLPESQWLASMDELADAGFIFAYPAYQFMLDFPLARWDDPQTTDTEQAALDSFATFMMGESAQAIALAQGLRPLTGEPGIDVALFADAEPYGIALNPDYGLAVQQPERDVIEALINLVD